MCVILCTFDDDMMITCEWLCLPDFLVNFRAHSSGEGEFIKDSKGANPHRVSKHMRYLTELGLTFFISHTFKYISVMEC